MIKLFGKKQGRGKGKKKWNILKPLVLFSIERYVQMW